MPSQVLEIICSKCQVSEYCPKSGSSPLIVNNKLAKCRLIGGYGRDPVDQSILSDESKKLSEKNGPCLTIAEIPEFDDCSNIINFKLTKIFSPPIIHARENVPWQYDMLYPKSFDPKV
jgi:hypothetical protein